MTADSAAPFHADIAQGPEGGAAHWLTTSDGLRIRAGHWPPPQAGSAGHGTAPAGTIFLFPGRTEYIEKYGPFAKDMVARGYCVLTVDWRGQGLADRALSDRRLGHVDHFDAFQRDVAALQAHAEALKLPKPWFVLGHSMGGAIALRALMNGLPVEACVFTAPMWGIRIPFALRPLARLLGRFRTQLGLNHRLVPTTKIEQYVQIAPFEGNLLTTDPEMYAFLQMQMDAQPDLVLGGPTIQWLGAAMVECAALAASASPDVPCITFLGDREDIVATAPIHDRMARWPNGRLEIVAGAQHEILIERPETRNRVADAIATHFSHAR
ncbi:alpha/beta fold hydrolase [Tritonibacter horizontis]|uniref:Lysophospholipase L2 n=1 Tax=Tritonibacter horizontis TaxID=1768241 RepID=A0A132BUY6_9RHOB|nr:alpha/beta hydrolase [Tritonibacter horizontis]KUP92104.1 lysophospholipase L2 [Tritonibacter horizontis]